MTNVLTENGSRRGTPSSLERQYTMYHGHDDQYGDYYSQQEPMDQNGQTKQTSRYPTDSSYLPSTYQQQNMYNAQKNSVYDEYSDQYGYTNFIRIYKLIPKHLRGLLKNDYFGILVIMAQQGPSAMTTAERQRKGARLMIKAIQKIPRNKFNSNFKITFSIIWGKLND